ncbi:MAG: hypothetical protein JO302_01835 [Candidatus Eremiobacteraeota bacterium]|nr:hypothetical protein [Candidatus Eremiobacteraeota bacterium]
MRVKTIVAAIVALSATACAGLLSGHAIPPAYGVTAPLVPERRAAGGGTSVLKTLTKQVVIGSTIAPNGDQNPYGLVVGTATSGKVKKGNLYVCNFNNNANVQGTGTTIVSLAPVAGSAPVLFAQSNLLDGCAVLTMSTLGTAAEMYAAAFSSGLEVTLANGGTIVKSSKKGLKGPFGIAYAVSNAAIASYATTAVYVSDAATGSIVLAEYCSSAMCTYPDKPIVTGFAVNKGKPGSILGPSGLTFDPKNCVKIQGRNACGTLYVVDGVTNTVVAIHNVLNLRKANSIVVGKSGTTFTGREASWAQKVYAGNPLKGPISAALLYNGNLVVGNTLNRAGTNLLVEINPSSGEMLDKVNVDKGPAGAIFGIVATGNATSPKVYFNDDNANNVQVLEKK